jgi:hypothetical protein
MAGGLIMGLFDWLKGAKAKVQTDDRVWLTKQAKFAGIQREIAQALGDPNGPDAVFVVAHFQDCLDELRSLVAGAGFDEGRVLVTGSEALEGRTAGTASDESRRILIIVGERHPLPSHNEALLEFAQRLVCPCRFVQHFSLEDPLCRMFAGEWVEGVLRRLGMKEDEPIESGMVGRRIRSAQQKIADSATGDAPAQSAREWLETNCPSE